VADRRSGGLAVLVAAGAVALAACGGSSSAHVASLPTSSGNGDRGSTATGSESSTTTLPTGDPTQLLDEWTSCMRSHGDPNQADPTIGANKVINLAWWPGMQGGVYGTNKGGQGNTGPGQFCRAYLRAAQTALQGGQPQQHPDPAKLEKYSECMRANGVPDFPDPSGNSLSINVGAGGDLNPSSPTFQKANKLCAEKTGLPGFGGAPGTQPGGINFITVGPVGGSGGNGGSGANG
jgi:hypothetical protein